MWIKDWKRVLLIGYSTWCFYILAALIIIPEALYFWFKIEINPYVMGRLLLLAAVAGVIGRLIEQGEKYKISRRLCVFLIVLASVVLSAPALAHEPEYDWKPDTIELVSNWEGFEPCAYQDIVGVWTIGYGHTRTAKPGMCITHAKAKSLLSEELTEYRSGVRKYFSETTKTCRMTAKRDAAYTSLAFNIGYDRAGQSTATKRLNKGDIEGGCDALTWWNRAGGRVIRGLVNRRLEERDYCLEGL